MRILFVCGTRPEAIKLAPIIRKSREPEFAATIESIVCSTGQHREMLDQVLGVFGIVPDYDLDIMTQNQSLAGTAASVLDRFDPILKQLKPDWVVVQGDTTTVAAASIAAFYGGIRVAHVEAGLRTRNKAQPFPEEINRRIAGVVADLHFAPTATARSNLLQERTPPATVLLTGNPVIDAIQWARRLPPPHGLDKLITSKNNASGKARLILLTAHRRENFGIPIRNICLAVRELLDKYGAGLHVVYPVHRNPNVFDEVHRLLGDHPGVTLLPPVDYLTLIHLIARSYLVLTDSGGIQEEAPALGKPVLVLRDVTERPEAVVAGTARLIGTDHGRIVQEASTLLDDPGRYREMAVAVNPYGDGNASERILRALLGQTIDEFCSPLTECAEGTI